MPGCKKDAEPKVDHLTQEEPFPRLHRILLRVRPTHDVRMLALIAIMKVGIEVRAAPTRHLQANDCYRRRQDTRDDRRKHKCNSRVRHKRARPPAHSRRPFPALFRHTLRQSPLPSCTWSTWSAVINLTSRAGELRSAPSGPDDRDRVTG